MAYSYLSLRWSLRQYSSVLKPGIVLGNVVTAIGGFAVGSRGEMDLLLLGWVVAGLSCVIASACICNNCIDRSTDAKMDRTRHRVLATGELSWKRALSFAAVLGLGGVGILLMSAPLLATKATLVGFGTYVLLYGLGKYISLYATLVGSLAGAIPTVVGYCAAANTLDLGAFLLQGAMICWQMPHFYSIALYRLDEYASTPLVILPVHKGAFTTKVRMVGYIIGWTILSCLLAVFGYAGGLYLGVSLVLGSGWLWLGLQGFVAPDQKAWARVMFWYSLVAIAAVNALYTLSL